MSEWAIKLAESPQIAISDMGIITEKFIPYADGRLEINSQKGYGFADGKLIRFSPIQRAIIDILGENVDNYVDSRGLVNKVYGYWSYNRQRTLIRHIVYTRRKLGSELGDPNTGVLRNVLTLGYTLLSSLKQQADPEIYSFADQRVKVDVANRSASIDDKPLQLSHMEYSILSLLAQRSPEAVSMSDINNLSRSSEKIKSNMPTVYIRNLRRRMIQAGMQEDEVKRAIVSIRNVGYAAMQTIL